MGSSISAATQSKARGTPFSANIVGCYNLFEQARHAGVKRIVFASSNHVTGFHPRTRMVGADDRVLPYSRYGVNKAFGEALGAMYAHKHGMGVFQRATLTP